MNAMEPTRSERHRRQVAEPFAGPALGALLLHGALAGAAIAAALFPGLFPHHTWGGVNQGGAVAVQLVSSALPLPADKPPTDNVLATDTPTLAPPPPAAKSPATVDESAIPIPSKLAPPRAVVRKQQTRQNKLKAPAPPSNAPAPRHPQPNQKPLDNRVQYGDQTATYIPRALQGTTTSIGQTTVAGADFGSRFPWYVEGINRKMSQNWNKTEIDPRTPKGTRVYLTFTIRRDGSLTDIQIDRSSGSPTLDRSCQRAAQRVDTFGAFPGGYNQSSLIVSYYCEY